MVLNTFFASLLAAAALYATGVDARAVHSQVELSQRATLPSGASIAQGVLCLPQAASALGQYPKSAVTTVQTGTDCTKYGDPPARIVSDLESPSGLEEWLQICKGEIVNMTDNNGTPRAACFYRNPNSTKAKPLPLLVWLNPSLVSATYAFPTTGIDEVRTTQSLNNEDPSRLGFSYILPFGRNTEHKYPFPDDKGLGWDSWYRNLDRSSSALNADVDFIDKAIAYAKNNVPVDSRRVFTSGWSNGAQMAVLYSLNTKGIAAASVYSGPDPYRDSQDPCTQVPHPLYATPFQDIHNECDIIGICTTAKYAYDDYQKRYVNFPNALVVIDNYSTAVKSQNAKASCDPACQGACFVTTGSLAHVRWPIARNTDTYFAFMRKNPLPTSESYGKPVAK